MMELPKYHGCLVALEGDSGMISTQLGLLPAAPQITILPDIHHYLQDARTDGQFFDARQFVYRVHKAAAERYQEALQFLQRSTADSKRIVFVHGGTVEAQALCISEISKHRTAGDLARAESIFKHLVRDGVLGLMSDEAAQQWGISTQRYTLDGENSGGGVVEASNEAGNLDGKQDPITRAMQAADALDRETESLQPPNYDIDLSKQTLTRRFSLPTFDSSDRYWEGGPPRPFDASLNHISNAGVEKSTEHSLMPDGSADRADESSSLCKWSLRVDISGPALSPGFVGELHDSSAQPIPIWESLPPLASPLTDTFSSAPQSPDPVIYGEATLVQMRSQPTWRPLRRISSLDRMFLRRETDGGDGVVRHVDETVTKTAAHGSVHQHNKRPSSCQDVPATLSLPETKAQYLDVPKTVFVKANQTMISRPSTVMSRERRSASCSLRSSHADKDTDANEPSETESLVEARFEPVLPFLEDVAIVFSNGTRNELTDLVVRGFNDGVFPVLKACSASSTSGEPSGADDGGELAEGHAATDQDEYDPYAAHGGNGYNTPAWMQRGFVERYEAAAQLPTPAQTPPPTRPEADSRFCNLTVAEEQTAIGVQNALRSVLSGYFPAADKGYHQSGLTSLPDLDSLWRPLLRHAGSGSRLKYGKRIDLILGIGTQSEVRREYSAAITGQIEKLGTKPSGISRSGRLDIQYLVANAMAMFTTRPQAHHRVRDDPFEDSTLLAMLVIPHLDLYMATHPDVRFLVLEYSAEYFTTMVALQNLIGSEVFKVAGILSIDECTPAIPVPSRTPSRRAQQLPPTRSGSSLNRNRHASPQDVTPRSPSPPAQTLSFSRANFILTSSANDSEIANFIAAIWKTLISISEFYVPEHAPHKLGSQRSLCRDVSPCIKASPPDGHSSQHYHQHQSQKSSAADGFVSQITSSPAPSIIPPPPPPPPADHHPPRPSSPTPSVSPSVRSGKSSRTWRTGISQRVRRRTATLVDEKASVQADGGDASDDECCGGDDDSVEYDAEERRLMPMFHRHRAQKINSRKALKWLGLA